MTSPASSGPARDKPTGPAPPHPPWWRQWLIPLGIVLTIWLLLPLLLRATPQLTYTQFVNAVDAGRVASVSIDSQGDATGTLKDGTQFTTAIPIALSGDALLARLEKNDVSVEAVPPRASLFSLLLSFAPFLLLGWFWIRMGRRAGTQFGGILGVGRSRAKVFDTEKPQTTFADVAGYEGVK
jgi:cell division protease FtsH